MKKILTLLLISTLILSACRKEPVAEINYNGVEIVYYTLNEDKNLLTELSNKFVNERQGLKLTFKNFTDPVLYEKTILNELAEGAGPDIFAVPNTWVASNLKKLSPLPLTMGGPADFEKTFVQTAVDDLVHVSPEGEIRVYAVPMSIDTLAIYYNKAHFEDRLPASGAPAKTWDGIKQNVVALNKEDPATLSRFQSSAIALGTSENITLAPEILYLMILQSGVQFYNENISEAIFAESAGIGKYPANEAIELFLSFSDDSQQNYSWNQFVTAEDENEITAFAQGKVSMIVGYASTYDQILAAAQEAKTAGLETIATNDIKVAPIPQMFDPDASGNKRITYANYYAQTVSRTSKNPEIAWSLLIELTKRDNLSQYFAKTNRPTSRRDMIDEQKPHPIYGVFADQISLAESFPILDRPLYDQLFRDLITASQDGEFTSNMLQKLQEEITALLPTTGLKNKIVEKELDPKE